MQDPIYLPVPTQKQSFWVLPPGQCRSAHVIPSSEIISSPLGLQETCPTLVAKLSLSQPSSFSEISCSSYTDLFYMPKDTRCSPPLCLCICGLLCLKLLHSLLSSFSAHRSSSYPSRPTPRVSFSVEPCLFPSFPSQPP